jgi:soluble lytic murein transglycosylase
MDPFLIGQIMSKADKFHLERVRELATLLMFEAALEELNELTNPHKPTPEFWYQLSQLYHLLGDYTKPIRLIQRVVYHAREKHSEVPLAVWKISYPLNYWPLIQRQAAARKLDPYLIAALIRQESVFDPESLSVANAIGLMQVIPATGRMIARKLKLTEFTPDMLYEPETNLAIGTYYLAQLLKKLDGNLVLALAAYNAGEKAAGGWWRKHPSGDLAQFIENIPYPETRNYIKQVWSNYNNYRLIYSGQGTYAPL